jgi:hypothetical protein
MSLTESVKIGLFTKKKGLLTKQIMLDEDGVLQKIGRTTLAEGAFEQVELVDLDDFDFFLDQVEPNQAVCYGRPRLNKSHVVSKELKKKFPNAMTRTADNFYFKGPTICMLDYDPDPESDVVLTRDQLRAVLLDVIPDLGNVDMLWRPSASSCIYNGQKEVIGVTGQRIYFIVDDGSRLKHFTEYLVGKLWLNGYGRIQLSRSGAMLERVTFDTSVWQPERLDYVAGAKCSKPLERRPVDSFIWRGNYRALDISQNYDLTPTEVADIKILINQTKRDRKKDQVAVVERYITERVQELADPGASQEELAQIEASLRKAIENLTLTADFILFTDEFGPVTVGEVLTNRSKFNGASLADPLEPDYGGGRGKAKFFLIGTMPVVHSFAHGSRVFKLKLATRHIQVGGGRINAVMDEAADALAVEDDIYWNDAGPLLVDRDINNMPRIQLMNADTLSCRLASIARFYTVHTDRQGNVVEKDQDPPQRVVQHLTKRRDYYGLRYLRGIISAPTLREDGSLLIRPGYDEPSRLLFTTDDPTEIGEISEFPDKEQVMEAHARLMEPFEQFDYKNSLSKGILLSGLLTAAVRKSLPTAPAIIVSATSAGSGKTKIAQCIDIMAGGQGATNAMPFDREELRKALTSTMLEGAPSLIYDNLERNPKSDLLNAILSSSVHSDRVIGTKDKVTLSTRMMFLLTGNNITATGDLSRRTLKIDLDPACENPWQRNFSFDPVSVVQENRIQMIVDALTILRGFLSSPEYDEGIVSSHTGSFEKWSRWIRQCVIWLGYEDPELSIVENFTADEETDKLRRLMELWWLMWGDEGVSNQELNRVITGIGFEKDEEEDMREHIHMIIPKSTSSIGLGRWLNYRTGRVLDGLRFRSFRTSTQRGWRLEKINAEPDFSDDFFDS